MADRYAPTGRFSGRISAAALLAALFAPAFPAAAAPRLTVLIESQGTEAALGRGLAVRGPSGCVAVTAKHALDGRQLVNWRDPADRRVSLNREARAEEVAPHHDMAILSFATPPSECADLPGQAELGRLIRLGARANVEVLLPDGSGRLIAADVTEVTHEELRLAAAGGGARDWVAPGMSGAPVSVDGRPIGILIGVDKANGDQIRVLRLDFIARMADPQWLGPLMASPASGTASPNSLEASRIFWNAFGLTVIGRDASARRALEQAANGGSAAARLSLAKLMMAGEGGPRDQEGGSLMFDRYMPDLFSQAEQGDMAAGFMLLYLNSEGSLTPEQRERAIGPVRAIGKRLAARSGSDNTAAIWWALFRLTDFTLIHEAARGRLTRKFGVTPTSQPAAPLLEVACRGQFCIAEFSQTLEAVVDAVESGNELAALFLGSLSFSGLSGFDLQASVRVPHCARFSEAAGESPLRAPALAACTYVRRALALRRMDQIAFDTAGDREIWKKALEAGMFLDEGNLVSLAGRHSENPTLIRNAAQRARDVELNPEGTFELSRLDMNLVRLDSTLAGLREYIARIPSGHSNRPFALSTLAALQMLGGRGVAVDAAGARETLAMIRNLWAEGILDAANTFLKQARWLLRVSGPAGGAAAIASIDDPNKLPPEIVSTYKELVKLAASKGSATAIMVLLDSEIDPAALTVTTPGRHHPYMREALNENPVEAAQILCHAAFRQVQQRRGSREAAIRICRSVFDEEIAGVANTLAQLYDNNPSERRKILDRAADLGSSDAQMTLAADLLAMARPDVARAHQLLRTAAARGETDAIATIMSLLVSGRLPWQQGYFQYLVRMADWFGGSFGCQRTRGPSGAVLDGCYVYLISENSIEEGGRDIAWLGSNPPVEAKLPILSKAQFDLIASALSATDAEIDMLDAVAPPPSPRERLET